MGRTARVHAVAGHLVRMFAHPLHAGWMRGVTPSPSPIYCWLFLLRLMLLRVSSVIAHSMGSFPRTTIQQAYRNYKSLFNLAFSYREAG